MSEQISPESAILDAAKRMQSFNALTQLATIPWDDVDPQERNHWIGLACAALRGGVAQCRQEPLVHIDNVVYHLDDIEVDADGKCAWTDVANALTHIKMCIEPTVSDTSTDWTSK